jgi:uncharacterized protein (TIGR02118 family)
MMIKRVSLVNRKAGMPVEEFQRYWLEVHAPLALKVPGLRHYLQSPTLPETHDSAEAPAYDGMVETWWDSVDALEQARKTPERALVDADRPNFIGASKGLIGIEVPLLDDLPSAAERQGMMKHISVLYRREGVSVEAFQTHWRDKHGPAYVAPPPMQKRYVQTHPLPETYGGPNTPACDGLAISFHDSLESFLNRPPYEGPPRDPLWTNFRVRVERIYTREIALL